MCSPVLQCISVGCTFSLSLSFFFFHLSADVQEFSPVFFFSPPPAPYVRRTRKFTKVFTTLGGNTRGQRRRIVGETVTAAARRCRDACAPYTIYYRVSLPSRSRRNHCDGCFAIGRATSRPVVCELSARSVVARSVFLFFY